MADARFFDTMELEWAESAQFPGVLIKPLETHATHPCARVTLVRLPAGVVIDRHVHEHETETAYVLAGEGVLRCGERETHVRAGMGMTVPARLYHSLRNSGDGPLELYAVHTLPPDPALA
jgi:mannose-6-phosphate isomerase-like protein (cupin superfamily)